MPIISFRPETFFSIHLVFRNNELLIKNSTSIELPSTQTLQRCLEENITKDWFSEPEHDYTALLLEDNAPTPALCRWIRLRELFALAEQDNSLQMISFCASRTLSLFNWRKANRFCGYCGGPTQDDKYESAKTCMLCGKTTFPRISPAIIVLVSKGDKILLARHSQRNTDVFTCLAGYVEQGENIEECVAREVKEECGIQIHNIHYVRSQHWPYPDQLMLGFTAEWKSGDLVLQSNEIDEASWFSLDKLPSIPRPGSMAHFLITGFLSGKR